MVNREGRIIYSPSDLVCFIASPCTSWLDRFYLENPGVLEPDEKTEDQKLIAETGNEHERSVLEGFKASGIGVAEVATDDREQAHADTLGALKAKAPIIFQAALEDERFAGFADFLILDNTGQYQVWDTKLAHSPKPYYAIQLCCYSEMLAASGYEALPEKFGIILGTNDRVEFRVEDFLHYYRQVKAAFLAMQDGFSGNIDDLPEPLPGADHGRWTSHAKEFFESTDHLVRVAGITVGQIKKLKAAGVTTMAQLADACGTSIPKLAANSLKKLSTQAQLQCGTRQDRATNPDAPPRYKLLASTGPNSEPVGLATLPPGDPADVIFDIEGYPLVPGGLEYLFGARSLDVKTGSHEFLDWWAHTRAEEKVALERFIDWVHDRWKDNPAMRIYHYGNYDVSALRRLSTRHDTRQDEVDDLLRGNVFVDLYRVLRRGLSVGEQDYSLKSIEYLYRPGRSTDVTRVLDSIVQYAHWRGSKEGPRWEDSAILKGIRDYNEDDCASTAELLAWLRTLVAENKIPYSPPTAGHSSSKSSESGATELPPEVLARQAAVDNLHKQHDSISVTLADLVDFHRREEKPMWWRMFDRAEASAEDLRDDSGCVQGVEAVGSPEREKRSVIQTYQFDPSQECKLAGDGKARVMFSHNIGATLNLASLDLQEGRLQLKISQKALNEKLEGEFPHHGSLIPHEYVSAVSIQAALTGIADQHLSKNLHSPIVAMLERQAPDAIAEKKAASRVDEAVRVAHSMDGECLVVQGPPGTGKTYTAAQMITSLLDSGKRVGVSSNSHKAIVRLLEGCGKAHLEKGSTLRGIKVGGDADIQLFTDNPELQHIKNNKDAKGAYGGGIVGGTAWLFALTDWEDELDFLFIDEAGQVSLANAVAMARSAKNIVLLGDQMQLEQPIQGTHPGDSGLSSLQYVLKDIDASKPDILVCHAVVPQDYGLFLGESRRMHPSLCRFVSETAYEGRLVSHPDCASQEVDVPSNASLIMKGSGAVFLGVEHDGNIQHSEEEVAQVKAAYEEMLGRTYHASNGSERNLALGDFLFITPYNAQVRALQTALPDGARVGSVDKFQGQEAPICIFSTCSSYGEYGSRGLSFILDRNRINVALSRAQCMAVIVGDPRIAGTSAGSINEMMLLNLFCKIVHS